MQKAHLYEAILLVNRGIDEAVHGLERLKRAKEPNLSSEYFDERLALFEEQRARLNGYFCNRVENGEAPRSLLYGSRRCTPSIASRCSTRYRSIEMSRLSRNVGVLTAIHPKYGS